MRVHDRDRDCDHGRGSESGSDRDLCVYAFKGISVVHVCECQQKACRQAARYRQRTYIYSVGE